MAFALAFKLSETFALKYADMHLLARLEWTSLTWGECDVRLDTALYTNMHNTFIIAGIGNAIAKALSAGGAETIALSRTQENLDKLKTEVVCFAVIHFVSTPTN